MVRSMSATQPPPARAEQTADFYLALLQKLALTAAALAERAGTQALAQTPPSPAETTPDPDPIRTFERMARCVRQCAAIANKIETDLRQPGRQPGNPAARRLPPNGAAVRTRVERAIHTNADPGEAEALLANLYDRLEDPDILHMLARHGIAPTVAALCAEAGLHEPLTNLSDEELAAWVDRLDPVEDDPDEEPPEPWPQTARAQANTRAPPPR
jgi:hypothetical protein